MFDENIFVKNFGDMKYIGVGEMGFMLMFVDRDLVRGEFVDRDLVRGEFGVCRNGELCDGSLFNSNSCSGVDLSSSSGKLFYLVCL